MFIKEQMSLDNGTIDEKLRLIGLEHLNKFLMFQQRDYAGIQAAKMYELRDKRINQMIKNDPDNPFLAVLISAHNSNHPTETYEKMKSVIVNTSVENLLQLEGINKFYKTNFTIADCLNKVFDVFSKEELKDSFIEEQKAIGVMDICPDLMSPIALKGFNEIVENIKSKDFSEKELLGKNRKNVSNMFHVKHLDVFSKNNVKKQSHYKDVEVER